MAFKLVDLSPEYWAPGYVAFYNADGNKETRQFMAQWPRMDQSAIDAHLGAIDAGTLDERGFLDENLLNWKSIYGPDGAALPCNKEGLDIFCKVAECRKRLIQSWISSINVTPEIEKVKN